jgi:peptidoglycan lytic transglycosylase G
MKKNILVFSIIIILALISFIGWEFFGSATSFKTDKYFFYIKTGATYQQVVDSLDKNNTLKNIFSFKWLAKRFDYPENVKAGKYEIKKGENLITILRMLRNGKQVPVNLTITKLRTKEDLAALVGRHLECDSASFMNYLENNDSLKNYDLDSNAIMTAVFPNTYTYFWNTTPTRIFKKFFAAHNEYWTSEKKQLADEHGLTPATAYILASIIEEETNIQEDKSKIASVYLNRINRKMKLAADPTVKYALRNFELKRIYDKYLSVESLYNTYAHEGLPPGPICTPSIQTIDAVINAPKTNYLYFVAKPDFSGYSNFSETYDQHIKFAREYQRALDNEMNKAKDSGRSK